MINWSLAGGTLPPGLALNASTGAITGTPSTTGTFVFTVQASDGAGGIGLKQYTVGVTAAGNPLVILPESLPSGVVGQVYSALLGCSSAAPLVANPGQFPAGHILRTRMDGAAVLPNSAAIIAAICAAAGRVPVLHPGFEIPVNAGVYPLKSIIFDSGDSDPGPYAIPDAPQVESGSDQHMVALATDTNKLYEVYRFRAGPPTAGGSGAIFDLNRFDLRTLGNTSADGAGLPMMPLLLRFCEFATGAINHPIRVTVPTSRNFGNLGISPAPSYSPANWPARHRCDTQNTNPNDPAMGERLRLKASFDASSFSAEMKIIITTLKQYGLVVADQGSAMFIQGDTDTGWSKPSSLPNYSSLVDQLVTESRNITLNDFEVVDGVTGFVIDPDSARANQPVGVSAATA